MPNSLLLDRLRAQLSLIASAPLDRALDDALARATAGTRVLRTTVEMIRFPGKASKLLATARLDRFPEVDVAAFEAEGFVPKRSKGVVRLSRVAESLLFVRDKGHVVAEHTTEDGDIAPEHAAESLAAIPQLAAFAPLALGRAVLKSWGLGRDQHHGLVGLVAIHRDLDRSEEDERALRDAGLCETGEEGLWSTRDGQCSLVWMGRTVYGYIGPVPEVVGGWV